MIDVAGDNKVCGAAAVFQANPNMFQQDKIEKYPEWYLQFARTSFNDFDKHGARVCEKHAKTQQAHFLQHAFDFKQSKKVNAKNKNDDNHNNHHNNYNQTSVETIKVNNLEEFNRLISDSSYDITLIKYFATWCSHCVKFKPEYEQILNKLQKELNGTKIRVLEMDADHLPSSVKTQEHIQGYPTVKLYIPARKINVEYNQANTADGVVSFTVKTWKDGLLPSHQQDSVIFDSLTFY